VSYFTSNYVFLWNTFFPNKKLQYPPTFDARITCCPSLKNVRDYLSWRQADCHINNLLNTCFWALVNSGKTPIEAEQILKGTTSADKNEMLFRDFKINYNFEPEISKKGSFLYKKKVDTKGVDSRTGNEVLVKRKEVVIEHIGIIEDDFWKKNPKLLQTTDE